MDNSQTPQIIAIATAINLIATGVFAVVFKFVDKWIDNRRQAKSEQHKNDQEARKQEFDREQEARKTKFAEQTIIIERQDKEIARKDAQIEEKDEAIEKILEEVQDYREELAELRMYVSLLREDMIAAGLKPRDMPPIRKRSVDPEFIAKTTQANTKITDAIDARLRGNPQGGADES